MKLVVVESPAKAKTINKYLGQSYKVIASLGHIRDLPSKNGSVLPNKNFEMKYIISDKAKKYVNNIKDEAKYADTIYLATDPDREGESIAWHIAEIIKEEGLIKSKDYLKRISFNEITEKAVTHAIINHRDIDLNLVNAQQARRALDYLVGFTLSPLLWRKLPGCKSAGRVQSVALRLICEREEEIEKFKEEEYWSIGINFAQKFNKKFFAQLTHIKNKKIEKLTINNKEIAEKLTKEIEIEDFYVIDIQNTQQKNNPKPPFITSSLQQEAANKLGFSAKKTMQVAQKLYEGLDIGEETIALITYIRTDGTNLATEAIEDIRNYIKINYGNDYLPKNPKIYKSKVKNAFEAHEAIRPTNINLTPENLKGKIKNDYYKLYNLIWLRTVACQMQSVLKKIITAQLSTKNTKFLAKAIGTTIEFDGFYKIYQEDTENLEIAENDFLPKFNIDDKLNILSVVPKQHFTQEPARYSEATLVKKLEELGIGRPSTYASIISVLQDRQYVKLIKKRFIPSDLGRLLTTFLIGFFQKYIEYNFTANLENNLDEIASGKKEWREVLGDFWNGFKENISIVSEKKIYDIISYMEKELEQQLFGTEKDKKCSLCDSGTLNLKLGKFGAFLACNNYPTCNYKRTSMKNNNSTNIFSEDNRSLGKSTDGLEVFIKRGPYGLYLQFGIDDNKNDVKPKRIPLPANIDLNNININNAMKLLNFPIELGYFPQTNNPIFIAIGRFGPYLKYLNKFFSISKKYDPFILSLDTAIEIINFNNEKKLKKNKMINTEDNI